MLNNILKTEEPTEILKNKSNSVTSLHILFVIFLLTVDFYSLFNFGIELKYFKYIIDYKELLIINLTIVSIFSLLIYISKKVPYLFALCFSFIIFNISITYYEYGVMESIKNAILYGLIFSIIINGNNSFYISIRNKMILSIKKVTSILAFLILGFLVSLIIYLHYVNINKTWNEVYIKDGILYLKKDEGILNIIKPKFFNVSRLEKTQDDITFINSKIFTDKLNKDSILINNKLIVNNKRFVRHFDNDEYKTFFILTQKNNAIVNLIIIFSKKDKNKELYQIVNIQKKELLIYN